MSRTLTAALLVSLLSTLPVSAANSKPPDDLEGSGYGLNASGYGSGDGSEQGEVIMDQPGSKGRTFDETLWTDRDVRSGYVIVSNSNSFLENKQIVAGIIAGGVTGMILAVIVATIFIYKWYNKDNEGYMQGQRNNKEEDD